MNTTYIHTLGDSTLDNLYWMLDDETDNAYTAQDDSVEGLLQNQLNHGTHSTYQVISHAYDGFTTSSVLKGDLVGRVLGIYAGYPSGYATDIISPHLESGKARSYPYS